MDKYTERMRDALARNNRSVPPNKLRADMGLPPISEPLLPKQDAQEQTEVLEFILDRKLSYCLGRVVKYVARSGKKDVDAQIEDLEKAMAYLNREILRLTESTYEDAPEEWAVPQEAPKEWAVPQEAIIEFKLRRPYIPRSGPPYIPRDSPAEFDRWVCQVCGEDVRMGDQIVHAEEAHNTSRIKLHE